MAASASARWRASTRRRCVPRRCLRWQHLSASAAKLTLGWRHLLGGKRHALRPVQPDITLHRALLPLYIETCC